MTTMARINDSELQSAGGGGSASDTDSGETDPDPPQDDALRGARTDDATPDEVGDPTGDIPEQTDPPTPDAAPDNRDRSVTDMDGGSRDRSEPSPDQTPDDALRGARTDDATPNEVGGGRSRVEQVRDRVSDAADRAQEAAARANQSVSIGATGLGTTGTAQSRTRERTPRASQSVSLGTEGLGTSLPRQERKQAAKEQIREQLTEQGVNPDNVDVNISIGEEGQVVADVSRPDQEQLGDIDWSFGLGDPTKDEVEQFVDETVGEQGSQAVAEAVGEPLRQFGQDAREADVPEQLRDALGVDAVGSPSAAEIVGEEPQTDGVPDTVGPGQAIGNVAIAGANIAEEAPRVPGAALEVVETGDYLLEATPIAGGSEEQFDQRAGKVATAGAALAEQTVERAREQPGPVAGELLLGAGLSRAVSASRFASGGSRVFDSDAVKQAVGRYRPDTDVRVASDASDTAVGGTQQGLGSGGAGQILDADAVDTARGVTGPSRLSLARGRASRAVERARTRARETVDRVDVDTDRVGSGLVPPRVDVDRGDTPDAPEQAGFSRQEILEGSPRDRMSGEVAERTLRERRTAAGDFEGAGQPYRPDRGATFDPETREIQPGTDIEPVVAPQTAATVDAPTAVGGGVQLSGGATVGGGVAATAGALERRRQAERVAVLDRDERAGRGDAALDVPTVTAGGSSPVLTVRERTAEDQTAGPIVTGQQPIDQRDRTRTDVDTQTGVFRDTADGDLLGEQTDVGEDSDTRPQTRPVPRQEMRPRQRTRARPEEGITPLEDGGVDVDERAAVANNEERWLPGVGTRVATRGRVRGGVGGAGDDAQRDTDTGLGGLGGVTTRDLTPGWIEETATRFATGGTAVNIAPTQDQLEQEAASAQAVGALPTRQFLAGGKTQAEIEAAQSFLTFGVVGGDDDGEEDSFFDFSQNGDDDTDGVFGGGL